MTIEELKALLDKARETFCLASPGSDEEFAAYLCGFDAASQIALSHCDALREQMARLRDALADAGIMRDAAGRVSEWFCTKARHLEGHRINALRMAMIAYDRHMQPNPDAALENSDE